VGPDTNIATERFRRNPFPYTGGKNLGIVAGGGACRGEVARHVELVSIPRGPVGRERAPKGTALVLREFKEALKDDPKGA
jgi:hypothetical protein